MKKFTGSNYYECVDAHAVIKGIIIPAIISAVIITEALV